MLRLDIIRKVKAFMDEVSPQGSLDELEGMPIDDMLNQAAIDTLAWLPAGASRMSKPLVGVVTSNANGSGYLPLPDDYIKLAAFKMVGWLRPVLVSITDQDPTYLSQHNISLRGGIAKPVVAVVNHPAGMRLEYYSLPEGATHAIEYGAYIPVTDPVDMPLRLMDALCWRAAELTFQVVGDGDRMQLCNQRFKDVCNRLST